MNASEQVPIHDEPLLAAFIREEDPRGQILHVLGEVDLSNADEFQAAVLEFAEGELIVDLTACSYMDSSGLRVLATAQKAERNVRVVIPKDGSVHRIFEITGLGQQFNACESVDAALRTQE